MHYKLSPMIDFTGASNGGMNAEASKMNRYFVSRYRIVFAPFGLSWGRLESIYAEGFWYELLG